MNSKHLILTCLVFLSFVDGVFAQYFYPNEIFPAIDIPLMLIGVTLSFMWYYIDSQEIQFKRGSLLNMGIIAIGFIAFPYYFFKSRGFKYGLVYTLFFSIVVVLWYAFQYLGAYLVNYVFQS